MPVISPGEVVLNTQACEDWAVRNGLNVVNIWNVSYLPGV